MKVAIVSESPADEAALRRLIDGVLGLAVDVIPVAIRHDSWPKVRNVLPSIIPAVYYQTDADGLVVVVDCDDSPVHEPQHDPHLPENARCRICDLLHVIARAMQRLKPRPVPRPLQVALGLAVPAIEAWWLAGVRHDVSEASWINARRQGTFAYLRPQLKEWLYGTERPTLEHETATMIRAAERIQRGQLLLLEQLFPLGFGLLASQLRGWTVPEEG
jgi:hypothetical protein